MTEPVLVIHGGAGRGLIIGDTHRELAESLSRVLDDVFPLLKKGASALHAVTRAVELLENDPLYNAGRGSKIQSDGKIRMSAAIMDGHHQRFAGCVNVESVKNPVHLAHALLDHEDRVLSGPGAKAYAKRIGLPFASAYTPQRKAEFHARRQGKTGTVGALALDRRGRLAAATSTGGRGYEFPCRVSDTPTVAGNFANRFSAVSATGIGENIVDFATSASICALVQGGLSLKTAVSQIMLPARRRKAGFGLIALDFRGRFEVCTLTPSLIWAAQTHRARTVFPPSK